MAGPLGVAYVDIEGRTDKLQMQVAGAVSGKFGPMGAAMGKDIIGGAEGGVAAAGGGLQSKVGGLFGSLKGMIAGAGVAAAGMAAFSFLKDSIGAASDAEESINAVGLVFGDTADQITNFGQTAATQVGLSATAFQDLATTTGALLKNKGIDDFTGKTIELTERAADMASVFNTDVDTSLSAIQSAIKGEFNPLEQFGVSLNAAAIQQKAMADNGVDTASALTDQQKATAALDLIMQQTADTQGDFQNTSDGLANSQRILSAEWEDSKATLGKALLPAVTALAGLLGKVLPPVVDALVPIFEVLGDVLGELADMVGEILPPLIEALMPILKGIGIVVKAVFELIKPVLHLALDQIKNLIDFVTAVFQGRWKDAWAAVKRYFLAPFNFVKDTLGKLGPILGKAAHAVGGAFAAAWRGAWNGIKSFFSGIWHGITSMITGLPGTLGGIPGRMLQIGKDIIRGLINGIKNMAGSVASAVKSTVMAPINGIKHFLHIGSPSRLMAQWGAWTAQGFHEGIRSESKKVEDAYQTMLPPDHYATTVDIAASAGAATSAAAAATGARGRAGGVEVTNNFHAPVGGSMTDFGREIAKQGALEMRFANA